MKPRVTVTNTGSGSAPLAAGALRVFGFVVIGGSSYGAERRCLDGTQLAEREPAKVFNDLAETPGVEIRIGSHDAAPWHSHLEASRAVLGLAAAARGGGVISSTQKVGRAALDLLLGQEREEALDLIDSG